VPYGLFIGEVVNFFIVATVLFIFIVKFLGLLMKSKQKKIVAPPPTTATANERSRTAYRNSRPIKKDLINRIVWLCGIRVSESKKSTLKA